ncbi:putative beta-amylase [Histomonas meleagridis]|uniref:putative beta-amylase n=1 Tax=Histomonas meleagridis TaxID=135588 RepID=UPI003559C535|nr:putative beta-amylase [Histomonas meleagridis]KAH0803213.1 putative beta-amylase [Histomonas meleagridis]
MFALLIASVISGCDVYVMSPLAMFDSNQNLLDSSKYEYWFSQLQSANVKGVMIDVWWGICEQAQKSYKFTGYRTVFDMLKNKGLKIIPVMSFHRCGGNVGDSCNIPIPDFVFQGSIQPYFVDLFGNKDSEYISFAYDDIEVNGRTPLQMYHDFMTAFKNEFIDLINDGTIVEIEVGAGPCGELRYPSYQLDKWTYSGCGAYQCYDPMMKTKFKQAAANAGHPEWDSPPTDTGDYNVRPGGSTYWNDGWNIEYGKFFNKWYSNLLIEHGANILKDAREIFGSSMRLSCKISGIHWQYTTSCHCAELTAGYYNIWDYDGYQTIINMFKQYNVEVCFTCLEMTGEDYSSGSNPPALVSQILKDTNNAGLKFEGENALERYDWTAYNQILSWVPQGLSTFTYLRLCDELINNQYNDFKNFVNAMNNA